MTFSTARYLICRRRFKNQCKSLFFLTLNLDFGVIKVLSVTCSAFFGLVAVSDPSNSRPYIKEETL